MTKILARMVLSDMTNRPALISPQYAMSASGSEVTSGRLMADVQAISDAVLAEELAAAPERNRAMASVYGLDGSITEDKPFVFANGYALIPIHGILINRFNWSWSFVTGYNFIRNQLAAARVDPDVKAIIFDVNSCGGTVAGCQETADAIYDAVQNGDKPIIAVVDHSCHSAAYFLASQCTHLAVTPSGNLGNIGVLWVHWDVSEAMTQMGIKVTLVTAGSHKTDGTPYEPLSDDVREEFQTEINATYDVFVAAVSRGRGIDEEAVRETEARCYGAVDAVSLGLADAVQVPSDAVEAYFSECADDDDTTGGEIGDDPDAEPSETTESKMAVRPNAVAAKPVAEPVASEVTSGAVVQQDTAGAVRAERERVGGIVNHAEATGREALANHLAFSTEMSVAEAGAILAAAPKVEAVAAAPAAVVPEEVNHFKAAMDAGTHPNVGANSGGTSEQSGELSPAARILASQRMATGVKAPTGSVH